MEIAMAAARVNLREVLRSRAVESYLRNFQGESHRLQELIEITLSYGIHCVSRNFQLKGMSIEELRSVTQYDQTKRQDFFVRNATKPQRPQRDTDPQQLFTKPPHMWRDGEEKRGVSAANASELQAPHKRIDKPNEPEVFFLPINAHKDKLDEIDFYTRVFGKVFVDMAWTTYSTRGSMYLDAAGLQDRLKRVDQRKVPGLIPPTELPVCSFVEFLNAYVKSSVTTVSTFGAASNDDGVKPGPTFDVSPEVTRSNEPTTRCSRHVAIPDSMDTRPTPPSTSRSVHAPASAAQVKVLPKSLQTVQSKIQSDLRAHKQKLLRVKKTQTQILKERLARARLDEYVARQQKGRSAAAQGKQPSPVSRMSLDKITRGAAALEIVDDFVRSPLMDKFSSDASGGMPQSTSGPRSRRDPLKEELFGTAAHDDSFLGCREPPAPDRKAATSRRAKSSPRNYSGWLGDYGPQHTKSVRPAWATDATGGGRYQENGESGDEENQTISVNQQTSASKSQSDRFEWKFDELVNPNHCANKKTGPKLSPTKSQASSMSDEDDDERSVCDGWSAVHSESSDPAYSWLKTVVQ